jgi:quercetin dioxygenase-like cupin family protein
MELVPKSPTTVGPAERFTGYVWVDAVAASSPSSPRFGMGLVRFAPGARTAWHVHAAGQTLHITQGVAIVQTRDGDTILAGPGETVRTPPGEWHWHGATDDTFMEHLALSENLPAADGPTVTWGAHVTDDEYQHALTKGVTHE